MRRFFGKGFQFTPCERVAETYKMERTKNLLSKDGNDNVRLSVSG